MSHIIRKQQPPAYRDWGKYKPFLRLDFSNRCCYCTIHEGEFNSGGLKNFCVEHFKPKTTFPKLTFVYSNLYYACRHCNELKGALWPSLDLLGKGFRFLDPCADDVYGEHITVNEEGAALATTPAAQYTILHIRLNRPYLIKLRLSRDSTEKKIVKVRELLASARKFCSIPEDVAEALQSQLNELESLHLHPPIPYELIDQR